MNEVIESLSSEPIQLPSKLRIKQRLGHVSTSRHFKEQVVPKVMKMGGETTTIDGFLGGLSGALFAYPDSNKLGMSPLGEKQLPKIVHHLVQDSQVEHHIMERWNEAQEEDVYQMAPSEDERQEMINMLDTIAEQQKTELSA